jgi:hypothetical protein
MMFSRTDASDSRYQCTSRQAEQDGYFQCLNGCDENHFVQGSSGPKKYCLSYFPNGGSCYMMPYEKPDILSCNGKAGGSNPPMWIILIGGSNNYMMLKTLLDEMLNLPGDAGFNPAAYWNAQSRQCSCSTSYCTHSQHYFTLGYHSSHVGWAASLRRNGHHGLHLGHQRQHCAQDGLVLGRNARY